MVTDQQVRRLMKLKQKGKTLSLAAAKAGMDEKTARKYLRLGKLPSEVRITSQWRTRFGSVLGSVGGSSLVSSFESRSRSQNVV